MPRSTYPMRVLGCNEGFRKIECWTIRDRDTPLAPRVLPVLDGIDAACRRRRHADGLAQEQRFQSVPDRVRIRIQTHRIGSHGSQCAIGTHFNGIPGCLYVLGIRIRTRQVDARRIVRYEDPDRVAGHGVKNPVRARTRPAFDRIFGIVWLKSRGCRFEEGTKHTKLFYRGKWTTLPRHGAAEVKTGTVEGIKKRLGLK